MMKNKLYHLYYSGIDVFDLDNEWLCDNKIYFCNTCNRLKLPAGEIDFVTASKINKRLDMAMVGHILFPGCMSIRLLDLLGENVGSYLNIGAVYNRTSHGIESQSFVSFTGKFDYVTLRGKKADIIDGKVIPENERVVCCPECGFKSRRERAPWFLYNDEIPNNVIGCTEMGILIHSDIFNKFRSTKLKSVRIEEVDVLTKE
ncbi:hypothetical protein [Morganella morganii]|uniref:hypothetical protein n=1 Tax=Morganella morganii TaxID=582 RepID=UPI001FFC8EB5|nr:hypothetical protein [Morganella morganii]